MYNINKQIKDQKYKQLQGQKAIIHLVSVEENYKFLNVR
ncbi:hypothetical protein KCTC52924_02837 [Arenibacter antarcticus]